MREQRRTFWWIEMAVACCTLASGCNGAGGFFCPGGDCSWSPTERARIEALADAPASAPIDTSNRYAANPEAAALGKMFYFDTRFSGPSTMLDALNRKMPFGRAAVGQNAGVGCVSCAWEHGAQCLPRLSARRKRGRGRIVPLRRLGGAPAASGPRPVSDARRDRFCLQRVLA